MRDPFVVTGCPWKMKSEFSEQFPQYNHAVVQVPSAEPAVSPGRGNASLLPKYPMGPGEACVFPAQIPSRGGPCSHTGSTGPWLGNPDSLKAAAPDCSPTAHCPQRPVPCRRTLLCKACAGRGGGGRAHAVVTEAEAPHTDLETPVVWLLMEIREEMVMQGPGGESRIRGRLETLGAQHSALGCGSSTLPGTGREQGLVHPILY